MENTLNPPGGFKLPLAAGWPTLGFPISLCCTIIGPAALQKHYIKYAF